ncbi:MAG: EAL domain-containing protein, partial [Clostridia bacterium]|nr:EAL domain-containing protein [Clostridia bacterium]
CILHKGEREAVRALDPMAKCNAFDYYAALSSRIVHSTKYPHYAVILLKVHYFNYYMEQYGEEFCKEMLQFVAKSIDRCVQNDEVMGYRGEGEFAITMHYTDDNELIGRIKLLHAILIVCPPVKEKNDKLRTACGIYPVTRQDHSSIETMVEKAAIAIASKNFDINAVYSFYTDETSAIVQRETEMERKMEMALKDGSFRVFYQPKYGVAEKGVHSAEALIRWYDAETGHYYYPADFLRLFEENGFIVEMDKFVIRQVATLLQDLTVRNIKVVPISVNISRVTAAQKDFVDFCMKIRQDFNLPNDLLTFEFSESFAHYDYEAMSRTLEVLEGRGFVCAIDGYGSGYSSYSILKELKFTEIKLDRFFLRKSARPERDREVLGDVIALSRKLGLRVVQEGVESQADFEWLIAQGCDAIQGFYYSKPLGMQDFIDFISKTELYGLGEIPGKNPDEKPADS